MRAAASGVLFLVFLLIAPKRGGAEEILRLLGDQATEEGLPQGWKPLTFPRIPRHTDYRLVVEEGRPMIRAVSFQSASGLYHPLDLDPQAAPILSWCWKINRVIADGDETRKRGDDYAARIYVTFRFDPGRASFWERTKFGMMKQLYGEYPPKGAINYIWANRLPKGETIANAYTDRARMVAVESGGERAGEWVCERRDLYQDYLNLFKEPPPRLSGVAVMTDTDDTGEEAIAFYADLTLQAK